MHDQGSSGPSCSNLTTSLVNVSLKFQTLILQIHCYFLLKKCENPLYCKGFSHFFNKKLVYLNTLLFFVEKKCENPLHCKGFSHFFNKNNSVFVTFTDICLTNLCLNDIVRLTML